jgi:acyl-CoA synthetase (AMP-forming)/AMP-acid ligase II
MAAQTTVDLLRAIASAHPDAEAFVEVDRRLTFSAWDRAADGVASAFAQSGVGRGDVVVLVLPSSIEYAVCYQAAMRLGAVTSGINPRLGPVEAGAIVQRCQPRLVVGEAEFGPSVSTIRPVSLGAASALDAPRLPRLDPADPVAIVWTSGTTGQPKGAVFDHRNLAAVAGGAGEMGAPFDRRFSPLPFSHVGYMTRPWEEIEKVITTIIPPTPWKAGDSLSLMERESVTVGQGVPTQWRLILSHPDFDSTDLSSLRIAGTGAAPVAPELVREMQDRLGCSVVIGYTSTEAAITTGSRPGDSPELIHRTVGKARETVSLRIVGDGGAVVGEGEIGRVQCRSGAVMRGYWHDPERTAEVLDSDGWLTTGDLGYLDEAGYLTLVGRRSEMYIRGGYNVYPAEVEAVLSEHPSVDAVAVVGLPDDVLGEIGAAFVVPAVGMTPDAETLRWWCGQRLADYKAPDRLVVVAELPLTAMNKVDKRALASMAQCATGR